tara:strand:+ start:10 stop:186 length:177 start_codon:yes stop_codon:yes gene_type:complete
LIRKTGITIHLKRRYPVMLVDLSKKEIKLLLSKLLSASDDDVSHLYDKLFREYNKEDE